jgi:hypothetical protein
MAVEELQGQSAAMACELAREIQHLLAAAAMLEIGKPHKARAAQACRDLASQRAALLDPAAHTLLLDWLALHPDQAETVDHGALMKRLIQKITE